MVTRPPPCAGTNGSSERLSYKFQRLREQIRDAIARGEFTGQLPGERELGRRFEANAKTVNKALCDLSSEGLLVRQIGRGTFVAPRDGSRAATSPEQPVVLLMPVEPVTSAHRAQMIASLHQTMEEKGAPLEIVKVERTKDARIALSGWPLRHRRATSALLSYPMDALSGGPGYPADDCIGECFRRHVPVVVMGALSQSAKVSAVAPDYGDAGFRLAEHLFQGGCESVHVLISAEVREAEMICSGAQAAGIRQGKTVKYVVVGEGAAPSASLNGSCPERGKSPVGIIIVGGSVLQAAAHDKALQSLVDENRVRLASVAEPGDAAAAKLGITSYEVDLQRIAEWTARLLTDSRPGQRPQELLIPGQLKVRPAQLTGRG